jgi:hypothetical protein
MQIKITLLFALLSLLFLSSCFKEKFTCESENALMIVNDLLVKNYEDNFYNEQKKGMGGRSTGNSLVDMFASFAAQSVSSKIEQTEINISNIRTEHASRDSGKKICKASFLAHSKVFTKNGKEFPYKFDYSLERGGNITYTLEQGNEKKQIVVNLFISNFDAPKITRAPSTKTINKSESDKKDSVTDYLLRPVK